MNVFADALPTFAVNDGTEPPAAPVIVTFALSPAESSSIVIVIFEPSSRFNRLQVDLIV